MRRERKVKSDGRRVQEDDGAAVPKIPQSHSSTFLSLPLLKRNFPDSMELHSLPHSSCTPRQWPHP